MRIGLLSDTHIPEIVKALPPQVKEVFAGVDLILHAGDIYDVSVLDELECLAPVLAARGDDDYGDAIDRDRRIQGKHTLTIEGLTLWLIHVRPFSWSTALRQNIGATSDPPTEHPAIIVCGDSHRSTVENHNSTLVVNPGSPTFPYYRKELGTVALLDINAGKAQVRLIQLR